MTDTTARFALPLLQPGQAQKELFHDEALALIDLAVQPAVESVGIQSPPADAAVGQMWILGDVPTDGWAGHAGALAGWTDGGWRFVVPFDGMTAWSRADACCVRYVGDTGNGSGGSEGGWIIGEAQVRRVLVNGLPVLGPRAAAVVDPAGGGTMDAESRAALAGILSALRAHGLIATA